MLTVLSRKALVVTVMSVSFDGFENEIIALYCFRYFDELVHKKWYGFIVIIIM